MKCMICRSQLKNEERWDGSITWACPLCKKEKGKSEKVEKEARSTGYAYGVQVSEHEKLQEKIACNLA